MERTSPTGSSGNKGPQCRVPISHELPYFHVAFLQEQLNKLSLLPCLVQVQGRCHVGRFSHHSGQSGLQTAYYYVPTYRQVVGRAAPGPAFQAPESSGATHLP